MPNKAAKEKIRFQEDIIASVKKDYEERAAARKAQETVWQINANFVVGNQYCIVGADGSVEDGEKDYYWQEREVFNHIAPIYEMRLAKLNRVRPKMSVRPSSGDNDDVSSAKVSEKILDSACRKTDFGAKIGTATGWSELAGSAFYKITWDSSAGKKIGTHSGKDVFEGDVRIDICPPYEIFPSSLSANGISECDSVIHAKAVPVEEIKRVWGKDVKPQRLSLVTNSVTALGLSADLAFSPNSAQNEKSALVIERYTRPNSSLPKGELAVVAGDKLLYLGELPYINGEDGRRELPFVKQDSLSRTGAFFGISPIERLIPIQRAYNAVKNRKHEFMNRIAMGVLAVEDGSVDTDTLESGGLCPGKILVYRQGSVPPRLLDPGRVPSDFGAEEDRLLSEFVSLSGVSEIMRSSSIPSSLTSGTALQLLIEQDDTRLSVTAENIRTAVKQVAKHILRLYKQFALKTRISRCVGKSGSTELTFWKASDLCCDDVVFETENELNSTPAANRNTVFELLQSGLLHDENGKLSDDMRAKILDAIGYGGLSGAVKDALSGAHSPSDADYGQAGGFAETVREVNENE